MSWSCRTGPAPPSRPQSRHILHRRCPNRGSLHAEPPQALAPEVAPRLRSGTLGSRKSGIQSAEVPFKSSPEGMVDFQVVRCGVAGVLEGETRPNLERTIRDLVDGDGAILSVPVLSKQIADSRLRVNPCASWQIDATTLC